jgi:hypothetical protein
MIRRIPRRIKRNRQRGTILKNRFFLLIIFLLFSGGVLFYFLILSDFVQIKEIKIESTSSFSTIVKDVVENNLDQTLFGLFSSRSIFLIKEEKIEELIEEKVPQIRETEIKKIFFNTLQVNLDLRQAIGLYCSSGMERCFSIDKEGFLFEKKEAFGESEIVIIDLNNYSMGLRSQALRPETIITIKTINDTLENDITKEVKEYVIFSSERLDVLSQEGWRVYFNLSKDIKIELAKLKFILEEEISSERLKDIEYIDLRFEKVFYQ